MAANVESMMWVGQRPWHGLGVEVPTEVTSREAIIYAGLDWTVEKQPVFTQVPDPAGGPPWRSEVEGHRAVVRTSDRKPLGIVGERYVPVQNVDAFAFMDSIVGEGKATFHTAGSLDGGRKVWMLAKLSDVVQVAKDDITERFLLLMNSFDGSTALRMLFTPIRVVCANTLNIALRQGVGEGIAIRHTSSATQRIDEARRALGLAQSYYAAFAEEAQRLATVRFTDAQMVYLAETLFPANDNEVSTRTKNAREKVVELFTEGQGHDAIRGTAWAALNAVAEFTDHYRSVRAGDGDRREARLSSIWYGSATTLKQQAHNSISQLLVA